MVAPVFTAEAPKGTSHMNEGEAEVLVPRQMVTNARPQSVWLDWVGWMDLL